jgi:hypothetical protein
MFRSLALGKSHHSFFLWFLSLATASALNGDEQEPWFLANDQLFVQFFANSPSSQLRFNSSTYPDKSFYTNVVWNSIAEGTQQWPIPSDFSFSKAPVKNKYGNETLLQRASFNTTLNNGSVLLADLYLTHEPINLTLTSSFNLTDDSFGAEGNRQASVRDDRTTTTIPLGSNSLFVRLRVSNWHFASPANGFSISGNVKASISGLDVSWTNYRSPTNNLATVKLPGGPRTVKVYLPDNATMGCDGKIKSVYLSTGYDIRSIFSPVSADIKFSIPPMANVFLCLNSSNFSVPCPCHENFIEFSVYTQLDQYEHIIHWWLIASIIALSLGTFVALIILLLCVARWYNKNIESTCTSTTTNNQGKSRRLWPKEPVNEGEEVDPLLRYVYKKRW